MYNAVTFVFDAVRVNVNHNATCHYVAIENISPDSELGSTVTALPSREQSRFISWLDAVTLPFKRKWLTLQVRLPANELLLTALHWKPHFLRTVIYAASPLSCFLTIRLLLAAYFCRYHVDCNISLFGKSFF